MKLRAFRESLGLKQVEMAGKIKVSQGALCSAERGSRFPDPATQIKIIRFSVDPKTKRPAVDANDILEAWCEAHGVKFPGAATTA